MKHSQIVAVTNDEVGFGTNKPVDRRVTCTLRIVASENDETIPIGVISPMQQGLRLVSRAPMGTPGTIQEVPPPTPSTTTWWQRHGTTAQWIAVTVAIFVGLGTLGTTIYFHVSEANAKNTDEHMKSIIGNQLAQAINPVNDNINTKTGQLNDKIGGLSERIARIEGSLGNRVSELETRADRQTSLVTLQNPARTLALVRAEIQVAEASGKTLPKTQLADYRKAVQALPASAFEYWTTVAAIINYQSKLNQMSGEAPDPATVSRPCEGITNEGRFISSGNTIANMHVSNCIADIDTDTFQNVTFVNSVIRYNGGSVTLMNVKFVNCRFVLNLPKNKKPVSPNLLTALLESGDKASIGVNAIPSEPTKN
jgi:hypothetical protein